VVTDMLKKDLTVLLIIAAAVVACSPGFDDVAAVTDLRVLAVSAEPSEQIYLVSPPAEVETTITLVIASPVQPDAPVDWRLTACVPDTDGDCEAGTDLPLAAGTDLPGEVQADVAFTGPMIRAAFDADPLGGVFGAALWVLGTVEQDGELPDRFLKRILLSPDWGLGRQPNRNPWIEEVLVGERDEEEPLDLDAAGIWRVGPGTEHRLLPVSPEASRETHVVPTMEFAGDVDLTDPESIDPSQVTFGSEEIEEALTYRFAADLGGLSVSSKSEHINPMLESDEDKEDRDLSVTWTAPGEPGEGTLWFIVGDDFAGVGWLSLPVIVE